MRIIRKLLRAVKTAHAESIGGHAPEGYPSIGAREGGKREAKGGRRETKGATEGGSPSPNPIAIRITSRAVRAYLRPQNQPSAFGLPVRLAAPPLNRTGAESAAEAASQV